MNGVTPDNDGNITLSASSVGAVGYAAPQSLSPAQQAQVRENINAPAPYEAGDNISITGRVITTKAFPCNPNLLDNWYFGNPVNQRGQTSYTGKVYGIDRWRAQADNAVVTVGGGGVTFSSASDAYIQLCEETLFNSLRGRQVTASALFTDGTLSSGTGVIPTVEGDFSVSLVNNSMIALICAFFKDSSSRQILRFNTTSTSSTTPLLAVKLELGSEQTLAHQENGQWVLNEIPDYGDQLAECQRYFVNLVQDNTRYTPVGIGVARSATTIQGKIFIPRQMRALPAIATNASDWIVVNGGQYLTPTSVVVDGISPAVINALVDGQNFVVGAAYDLFIKPEGKCTLSADL